MYNVLNSCLSLNEEFQTVEEESSNAAEADDDNVKTYTQQISDGAVSRSSDDYLMRHAEVV